MSAIAGNCWFHGWIAIVPSSTARKGIAGGAIGCSRVIGLKYAKSRIGLSMQNTLMSSDNGGAAPALPRLGRQRLHHNVVEHLQNLITEGMLAPGTKLNERKVR